MDDDSIQIYTSNQTEVDAKLAKKKKILNEKKTSLKNIKKVKKDKLDEKKKLGKKVKKQKADIDTNENVAQDDEKPKAKHKFDKPSNGSKNFRSGPSSSSSSKTAKFSSLFKNNHEIPRVGEYVALSISKIFLFKALIFFYFKR